MSEGEPLTLMALSSDLISRILIEVADSRHQGQEAFGATTRGDRAAGSESLSSLTRLNWEKHKLPPHGNLSARVLIATRAGKLALINKE